MVALKVCRKYIANDSKIAIDGLDSSHNALHCLQLTTVNTNRNHVVGRKSFERYKNGNVVRTQFEVD